MGIDLSREQLLTLTEAAKLCPRRNGRKAHASSLWRWAVYGCRDVQLEAVRTPKGWATSREAVQRFFEALADGGRARRGAPPGRREVSAWANAVLDKAGI